MAQVLNLEAIPNQSISANLDGDIYDLTIKAANDVMVVTVARNGETIVESFRALSGVPIIPFEYLTKGNFLFVPDTVTSKKIPFYTDFGNDIVLVFYSASEIEEFLNG